MSTLKYGVVAVALLGIALAAMISPSTGLAADAAAPAAPAAPATPATPAAPAAPATPAAPAAKAPAANEVPVAPVAAEKNVARVDLVGDGVSLGSIACTGGVEAVGDKGMFHMPVTQKEWKQGTIKFKPSADGKIRLILRGPFMKEKTADGKDQVVWAYFDDVTVEGATNKLANGDFEAADKKGRPSDWVIKPGHDPVQVTTEGLAKTGKAAAKAWHRGALEQVLTVKSGQEVTVTFWVRGVHPIAG